MPYVHVISLSRCRRDGGVFLSVGGHELALFRLSDPDRVVAVDNACPHAGGNLSGGSVAETIVTCPWHKWQFDLDAGQCVHSPAARLRRYSVEIRDDEVWVDLPVCSIHTGINPIP